MTTNEFADILDEHLTLWREILPVMDWESRALRGVEVDTEYGLYQEKSTCYRASISP